MTGFRLTIGYLYPGIMCACGDRGNVETVLRRCAWRDIEAEVTELHLGDRVQAAEVDLLMLGSGRRSQQLLVAGDLARVKGPAIREAVAQGAAMLAVAGGYQLLGRFCQPVRGAEIPGAALFDAWTFDSGADLRQPGTMTGAGSGRAIGDLVVRWDDELLIGFQDHGSRTYLGPTARALGRVLIGHGNNGEGHEGVILGNAIGTYLRGPCLPRNPALADFLIRAALARRYGHADLQPLPDRIEHRAHQAALRRVQASSRSAGALTQRLARLSRASRRSRPDPARRQLESAARR